jgi:hypothetical protein
MVQIKHMKYCSCSIYIVYHFLELDSLLAKYRPERLHFRAQAFCMTGFRVTYEHFLVFLEQKDQEVKVKM